LDLDFNGYTVVTYWPSQLPTELIAATEVILVTRESNLDEIGALRKHCDACRHLDSSAWQMLPDLRIDQAVALPVTDEADTELRRFVIGERLTPHVRHRQKYVDVPVPDNHAFTFDSDHRKTVVRAHTLREFASAIEDLDEREACGYLRRGDFSRWIGDVFGDHAPVGSQATSTDTRRSSTGRRSRGSSRRSIHATSSPTRQMSNPFTASKPQ
jgi:hypothetical protein